MQSYSGKEPEHEPRVFEVKSNFLTTILQLWLPKTDLKFFNGAIKRYSRRN